MHIQSTLPKSNSHKSNNRLSRRSFQVLFSLYYIVFNPSQVKFSLSRSYFFSPNRFDLGKVDCIIISYTVEPPYNKVLGTMKITLLYSVSGFSLSQGKKTKKYKELGPAKLPCYKGFVISSLYNKNPLY